MIAYTTLLSLTLFTHGQPPIWAHWTIDSVREALDSAYAVVHAMPFPERPVDEPVQVAMARPGVKYHVNSGHTAITDLDDDEEGDNEAPSPAVVAIGAPVSVDAVEEPGADSAAIGENAEELDQPAAADEFGFDESSEAETPVVTAIYASADAWAPISSHDAVVRLASAGEDVPPESADEEEEGADFEDFGSSFSYRNAPVKSGESTKDNSTEKKPPADEIGIKVSTETSVTHTSAETAPTNENPGLASDLRSKIGITRMTLKDQPSDLIRVAVNSSIVVDLSGPVDGVNIVDPNIAEVIVPKTDRVIVVGKESGTTQLVLTVGQDHRVFHVLVEPNLVVLTNLIRSLSPRSDVKLASVNGQIILQGFVADPETARQVAELAKAYQQGRDVINHLTVAGTQQTMLRVVVAEVNKEALRNLGFNWAIGGADWSRDFFFANNVAQLNPTAFSSSGLGNVLAGQMTYGVSPTANGANTNVTFGFPKAEMQVFLNALRQNGLARTLAEPNLVAISGQTATFLAGGEVPIPVSQGGAVAGAITLQYKEFGVRLAFTPTVCADQIIRLHVMTEVSDAVAGARTIDTIPVFTFKTRRVESTIECPNGATFAIAGLLNEQINAVAQKIPGLGDVPVLGSLFNSVDYQKSNTEMVVLVTPQLARERAPPRADQVVPVPGQNMRSPSDFELFALSELEGKPASSTAEIRDERQEPGEGTLVRRSRPMPAQARLHGLYGIEDQEPGALSN